VTVVSDDDGTRFELRLPWTDPDVLDDDETTAELALDAVAAETATTRIPRRR
jgi:hypothetical protein